MATGSGVVPRRASFFSRTAPHMPTTRVLQRPAGQVRELDLQAHRPSGDNPSARLCFGFVLVLVFGYLRHPEFDVVLVSQGRSMKLQ